MALSQLRLRVATLLHYLSYKLLMVYGAIYFVLAVIYLIWGGQLLVKAAMVVLWLVSTPLIVEFLRGVASVASGGALFTQFSETRRHVRRGNAAAGVAVVAGGLALWVATLAMVVAL